MIWRMIAGMIAVQLTTVPAAAQITPSEKDTIDVVGQAPEAIRDEAQDYVQQLGVVVGERPAGRWVDPVCPGVVGVNPQLKAIVEKQIRAVAAAAKTPLAVAPCKPNLLVTFTEDAPGLVRLISRGGGVGAGSYEERRELETGQAPIRWWYNTEIRGEDGSPASDLPALGMAIEGIGNYDKGASGGKGSNLGIRDATLVGTRSMRAISNATVVIDVNRATGKPLSSVVDYAALVGLAEIRAGAAPRNSILTLFGANDSKRLTGNDRALLRGLYELHLPRKADQHRRVLISKIVEERVRQ